MHGSVVHVISTEYGVLGRSGLVEEVQEAIVRDVDEELRAP